MAIRARTWAAGAARAGGSVVQDLKVPQGITHVVVVGGGISSLPPLLRPPEAIHPPITPAATAQPHEQAGAPEDSRGSSERTPTAAGPEGTSAGKGQTSAPGKQPKRKRARQGAERQKRLLYVSHTWLEQCLAQQQRLPEADFPPPEASEPSELQTPANAGRPPSRTSGSLGGSCLQGEVLQRQRWLGPELWHPRCAEMPANELAVYSQPRSRALGNEAVVQALRELAQYEQGLNDDVFREAHSGREVLNCQALRYSRAAAAVRACAYELRPNVEAGDLPFVGAVTARQINDIMDTGSCAALDCFRRDAAVTDSRGRQRFDSAGAAARLKFGSLPGVGVQTARRWWDLGCRSFEDAEAAAAPGGALAEGGSSLLTTAQRFSLQHRRDLLAGATAGEVEEMREAVQRGLQAVSCPGWRIELAGGGRRSSAVHDADFLITHTSRDMSGVVPLLRDHLVSAGRLVEPEEGLSLLQDGLMPTHIERLKASALRTADEPAHQNMDRFDHIYSIYRTTTGKCRRIDIICVPPEEFPFAVLGWTGSRTYLRLMRDYAKDRGLVLTSHRLMQVVDGEVFIVPDERPPTDKDGKEQWPSGWHPGRRVESERDIFELLSLPYREPHERNAP
ncbi:hypothetical protein D9Q98_007318 [Chlorella vulgaris]|uniref:DNA polymerase n=1 Tax=Chlorella vulgaris TaxID=3077 RepID=A0A9D4TL83_CHLVU|nr:hypothetical protein D9Q98_007318 [Chlorella vulgaris]